jgi:uncharacterized protein (DUF488 family)
LGVALLRILTFLFEANSRSGNSGLEFLTIGHSTRSFDELLDLLKTNGIKCLADIRTIPRSRTNPQFNMDTLSEMLEKNGINYVHLKELGGLRRPKKDSLNKGWRNDSFRGFADYMQTKDFERAIEQLIELARKQNEGKLAFMCAESLPWRCHRSLISDYLVSKGFKVRHIIGKASPKEHKMTPFAKLREGKLCYPAEEGEKSEKPQS